MAGFKFPRFCCHSSWLGAIFHGRGLLVLVGELMFAQSGQFRERFDFNVFYLQISAA